MSEAQQGPPHREWGFTRTTRVGVTSPTDNNFFSAGSPYLTHPLLTPERTRAEVDSILAQVAHRPIPAPVSVLDVGCGFGRHCIEFLSRGLIAVGVDPSETMIDNARRGAADAGLDGDFRVGTVSLGTTTSSVTKAASFDLAICLFTTLGQQTIGAATPPDADQQMLSGIHRACRPGATLVVELPERLRALETLVASEALGPTQATRRFDETTSVLHERFDTPSDTFDLSYRLYSSDEVQSMLTNAGFTQIELVPTALMPPPPTFMTFYATA